MFPPKVPSLYQDMGDVGLISDGFDPWLTMSASPASPRLGKWLVLIVALTVFLTWQAFRMIEASSDPSAQVAAPLATDKLPPQVRIAIDEPQMTLDLPLDKAREINASVPMVPGGVVAARPYVFAGSLQDRDHAASCLAAAVFYEAGDDLIGQKAVAQVVLNRARHPIFPKSICAVVFQGTERKTGCQFSFTCDGSMARRVPSAAQWQRARTVATEALSGAVFSPVGLATHYHTDWVVPYWSSSLDKIAQVGTHLFFRWRGSFGSSAVFGAAGRGPEVVNQQLAALFGPGLAAGSSEDAPLIAPEPLSWTPDVAPPPPPVVPIAQQSTDKLLHMEANATPAQIAGAALKLCQGQAKCQVFGYVDAAPDKAWASVARADFYYDGGSSGSKLAYWNCHQFSRKVSTECLPGTGVRITSASADGGPGV